MAQELNSEQWGIQDREEDILQYNEPIGLEDMYGSYLVGKFVTPDKVRCDMAGTDAWFSQAVRSRSTCRLR